MRDALYVRGWQRRAHAMTEIPAGYMDLLQEKKAFANLATILKDG